MADNESASVSETTIFALKAYSNAQLVGERTWGATGVVAGDEVFRSGPFKIDGFLDVTISSTKFQSLSSESYEGIGIKPIFILKMIQLHLVLDVTFSSKLLLTYFKDP